MKRGFMKALIVHYALLGHTHFLAGTIEKGAGEVKSVSVDMRSPPETLSGDEIERKGKAVVRFQRSFMTIPICSMDDLRGA